MEKILKKDWGKSMPLMLDNNKSLKLKTSFQNMMTFLKLNNLFNCNNFQNKPKNSKKLPKFIFSAINQLKNVFNSKNPLNLKNKIH